MTAPGWTRALANHYRSVDSAPAGFSAERGDGATVAFLITFASVSTLFLCGFELLMRAGLWDGTRDLILVTPSHATVQLPLRLFVLALVVSYGIHAYSNWWRRLALIASMTGKFLIGSVFVDVGVLLAHELGWTAPGLTTQEVLSALLALAAFPHTVLVQARLPVSDTVVRHRGIPWRDYTVFAVSLAVGVVAAVLVGRACGGELHRLRGWALLGGMGPGFFLVQQAFNATAAGIGLVRLRHSRRHDFAPDLGVVIPAHNEAHGIAATVAAVDRAAAAYGGRVRIYVVDNLSRDDTADVATAAVEACVWATGVVLSCTTPGKAHALNLGLDHVVEEYAVRIDADTLVGETCLGVAMRHFARPEVGAVGGLPLPLARRTWIDRVRLVEVLVRHGFFQVAQGGFGGVVGVPGMLTALRMRAVREIGGAALGMNGEDTDMCIRMSALGYETIADPAAVYRSETPLDYGHLREQRTRWFRSLYHLASHNRGLLLDPRSVIGTLVLPFMLISGARRAALGPLVVFAGLVALLFGRAYPLLRWQSVLAMLVGMPLFVALAVLTMWRSRSAYRGLPAYLGFRLLRSFFTMGSTLSLVYPPVRPRETVAAVLGERPVLDEELVAARR